MMVIEGKSDWGYIRQKSPNAGCRDVSVYPYAFWRLSSAYFRLRLEQLSILELGALGELEVVTL